MRVSERASGCCVDLLPVVVPTETLGNSHVLHQSCVQMLLETAPRDPGDSIGRNLTEFCRCPEILVGFLKVLTGRLGRDLRAVSPESPWGIQAVYRPLSASERKVPDSQCCRIVFTSSIP